jgi:hypothetical protein
LEDVEKDEKEKKSIDNLKSYINDLSTENELK